MANIEDSIRRCDKTLERAISAVREIKEHSDPIEYEKSLAQVLDNKDLTLEKIYTGTEYARDVKKLPLEHRRLLEEQISSYVELKGLMKQTGAEINWSSTAVFSTNKRLEEIAGRYMGFYGKFCMDMLAVEVIHAFTGRKLSKAEEADDKGNALNEKRKYQEALPYFDEAIKLSPKFSLAWINKGIALKNLGRVTEAIACYDHVINNIDKNYRKAWGNKANALLVIGDKDNARRCVDQALKIDPTYQYARNLKMRIG